jgi:DNA-binding IscR family transcriptional regulator
VEHPEPVLVKCSRVLELVLAGHLQGKGVSDKEISSRVRLTTDEHDRVFATLRDLKLLTRDEEDRWLLARSLKTLTLWDLYQRLPDGVDSERLAAVEGMDHVVEPLRALVQFGSNQMSVSLDSVFGGVG